MKEQANGEKIIMTSRQAAELLRVSVPTLRKYYKTGIIPVHRLGHRLLFIKAELMKAVVDNRVETNMEKL